MHSGAEGAARRDVTYGGSAMSSLRATQWFRRLDLAREAALRGEVEGVHQVRVCCRRLRVWLALGGHAALAGDLRWLTRELGPLRDLDVLDAVLTTDARAQLRPPAVQRAVTALESERWRATRLALEGLPRPRRRAAKKVLARLERKLREERFVAEDESLHRLRRRLRALRYAREWLGVDASDLAADQAWLGALADLRVLTALKDNRE